jgi:hypothetical protein
VKLRHAAALTLVGWYLMVPPSRPVVDLDAPLRKWTVLGATESRSVTRGARISLLAALSGEP